MQVLRDRRKTRIIDEAAERREAGGKGYKQHNGQFLRTGEDGIWSLDFRRVGVVVGNLYIFTCCC